MLQPRSRAGATIPRARGKGGRPPLGSEPTRDALLTSAPAESAPPPMSRQRTLFLVRSADPIWSEVSLLVASLPDVTVVGEARAVEEAAAALAALAPPPDLIITAPRAPGFPVQRLLRYLRRGCPSAHLLVFTEAVAPDDLAALAAPGIERYAGYLLWQDLSATALRQCLSAVSGGILTISRAAAERFLCTLPVPLDAPAGSALSPREQAVLAYLAAGYTERALGARRGISYRTVKRLVASLHVALDASTPFVLGARAATLGLIPTNGTARVGDAPGPVVTVAHENLTGDAR